MFDLEIEFYLLEKILNISITIYKDNIDHIKPRLPAVKPTAQKKTNSINSLLSDGIELNTTFIR